MVEIEYIKDSPPKNATIKQRIKSLLKKYDEKQR